MANDWKDSWEGVGEDDLSESGVSPPLVSALFVGESNTDSLCVYPDDRLIEVGVADLALVTEAGLLSGGGVAWTDWSDDGAVAV